MVVIDYIDSVHIKDNSSSLTFTDSVDSPEIIQFSCLIHPLDIIPNDLKHLAFFITMLIVISEKCLNIIPISPLVSTNLNTDIISFDSLCKGHAPSHVPYQDLISILLNHPVYIALPLVALGYSISNYIKRVHLHNHEVFSCNTLCQLLQVEGQVSMVTSSPGGPGGGYLQKIFGSENI